MPAEPARGNECTALVADDDADVRELVSIVVRRLGCATRTVGRGDDALAAVDARSFRLAVLDVQMPGTDGLEVCRRIKHGPGAQPGTVVLMSGASSPADVAAGFAAGADDFLAKPFRPGELEQRLRRLLKDQNDQDDSNLRTGEIHETSEIHVTNRNHDRDHDEDIDGGTGA